MLSRAILDRKDRTKSSTGASGDVEMVDVRPFHVLPEFNLTDVSTIVTPSSYTCFSTQHMYICVWHMNMT